MTEKAVILGTAGHIDHGKTALVKALTGIDTDRLKEEQRRGITIELGFAHLLLGQIHLGIVDVPGHERFIKSMVAGAAGIDLVLLVVASDEGVMPQTREHLDICRLLRVQRGLVALTKADLVEPDWLELVTDDLRGILQGTFLEDAPVVPCSAVTGQGLDALKQAILTLARDVTQKDPNGLLRLPLDRVFTMKGFGTVVTGTLASGTLSVGDPVVVLPTGLQSKVRGLQVHSAVVPQALAGQRTAVNLGGVDRQEVARGEVLARPDTLSPSSMIEATITLLPGTHRSIGPRTKVLFHLGTRQQEATCVLLDRRRLEPGETGLAQIRCEQPVVALPGDPFILRGFRKQDNYGTTVGGGLVIRVLSRRIRPKDTAAIELLGRMVQAGPQERVELELLGAGAAGLSRVELQRRLPLVPAEVDRALLELMSRRQVIRFDRESGSVVHAHPFDQLCNRLVGLVDAHHASQPLEGGISREELRSRLGSGTDPRLYHALLQELERKKELVLEQNLCRRPAHQLQETARSIRPLAEKIQGLLDRAGLGPLREDEIARQTDAPAPEVLAAIKLLSDEGKVVRVGGLPFDLHHVEKLEQRLVAFLQAKGQISAAQFKELVGQSRKFTIPLAEYFDARKVTLRVGEVRKLRI